MIVGLWKAAVESRILEESEEFKYYILSAIFSTETDILFIFQPVLLILSVTARMF